jgi:hypothetical protein
VLRRSLRLARESDRIVISGRTDSVGPDEVNQQLALARALAVRNFIRDAVPDLPNVIAIDAKGRCCFIAPNDDEGGRSRNRRVEVVFTSIGSDVMDRPVARPCAHPSQPTLHSQPLTRPRTHRRPHPRSTRRKPRPGWKATIVRSESFAELRRIQKSTRDPVIDLSYLADACVELALELGAERIVQRAIASFGSRPQTTP